MPNNNKVLRPPEFSASQGGNSGDGDMWQHSVENRLSTLDTHIEDLRKDVNRDFRWTWAGLVAATVAILGVLAKGFGWV